MEESEHASPRLPTNNNEKDVKADFGEEPDNELALEELFVRKQIDIVPNYAAQQSPNGPSNSVYTKQAPTKSQRARYKAKPNRTRNEL